MGILIILSLITSISVPQSFAMAQKLNGPTDNLFAIESDLAVAEVEIATNEEENAANEPEDKWLEESSGLDISQEEEKNLETSTDFFELDRADNAIIDWGEVPSGRWVLYADGHLTIEGVITREVSAGWENYAQVIESIEFGQANLYGSFRDFFSPYTNLKAVEFGYAILNDVTSMEAAFAGLAKLERVSFRNVIHEESVLSVTMNMFFGCTSLTEVDFGSLNTSAVWQMAYMFYDCTNLMKLDVSRFDTSAVIDMSYMFFNCRRLIELDVSSFDTRLVRDMNSMFYGCRGLIELDLKEFDTSAVRNMASMFYFCDSLTKLDVSGFDTSAVTNMSRMFSNCSRLPELNVSSFNTSSVTTMSGMFEGCYSLTKLDVSVFDTRSVWNMNSMFFNCNKLSEIDLSSFDTSAVNEMESMFAYCTNLSVLDLTNFDTSSLKNIYKMFEQCKSLKTLDLSSFDTKLVTNMSAMLSGCTSLTELDLSNFNTSRLSSMASMFSNCYRLSLVRLGQEFKFSSIPNYNFPALTEGYAWKEENSSMIFSSSDEMVNYHNEVNEAGVYRKVAQLQLTMNANGGSFIEFEGEDVIYQETFSGYFWAELIPIKENCGFDGWYVDQEYTTKFDFSQPAAESLTIYAKWIESFIVTIPATININSEDTLSISGVNNGEKTLEVSLKQEESQIDESFQLKLIHERNADIAVYTQLKWEQHPGDRWNVLTVEPGLEPVSKSSNIQLMRPETAQAGSYEGQLVFSIKYE
ncbi:BspA family leucine-rich repeat surface protein [Enterococcus sp. BWR-S5]|uniref:BspA family leucine-rich repeat surface protein n=1 Tax=Enterococcus sp. BWR-S5 TaxID=2787714 RepID=UPI001924783B|nr:BspA family leucine-rich repeat surface protein [Enterococcus sp. BWR-S5]MBL1225874.1 BspA family leucine-rich repeat surface protein [Enterococcus sp. BWR-S5]